jgi:hypothetical protein
MSTYSPSIHNRLVSNFKSYDSWGECIERLRGPFLTEWNGLNSGLAHRGVSGSIHLSAYGLRLIP